MTIDILEAIALLTGLLTLVGAIYKIASFEKNIGDRISAESEKLDIRLDRLEREFEKMRSQFTYTEQLRVSELELIKTRSEGLLAELKLRYRNLKRQTYDVQQFLSKNSQFKPKDYLSDTVDKEQ